MKYRCHGNNQCSPICLCGYSRTTVALLIYILISLSNGIYLSHTYRAAPIPSRLSTSKVSSRCSISPKHRQFALPGHSQLDGSAENADLLITTPLFYVNGELHIGHAYTLVAADMIKRYNEISGNKTLLLSGTDEHGTKIHNAAVNSGNTPRHYIELMRLHYEKVKRAYNVEVDIDVHTAHEEHTSKVKSIFQRLLDSGDLYEGMHEGYFSPTEDAYYTEFQLVDGKSPNGFEVQKVAEKAFFFRLSRYRDRLRDLINKDGLIIPEERKNEVSELLNGEIPDVAVTRSNTNWGVPVNVKGFEGHTVYVWLDALLGYITDNSVGNNDKRMIMVFGKDILRFITLFWPALCIALGKPPPHRLVCHGWVLHNREKMSKSKGEMILALPPPGIPDVSRFVMMSLGSFGNDFQYDENTVSNLSDFVKDKFANLVHRVTSLLNQRGIEQLGPDRQEESCPLVADLMDRRKVMQHVMDIYRLDKYVQEVNQIALEINNYITVQKIWDIKCNRRFKRQATYICQSLLILSLYVYPIMPDISSHTLERLRPHINGDAITPESGVNILQSLERIAFKPQHIGPLM
ncbi:methionyl-tRNA synthetase [Babesia gibsoni]|uniref:methionine--tRNA ligase n=1 Tax=Babesia gibsoni TaxID=33632 RepID=A0AAD8PCU0_BABGI|nr:methionyl-tRNA synthetase [Babesia gibsoni]